MQASRLTRDKLQRGDIKPWRCKAARNLRCMRLGKFRLISRHYMRGLRYWRAPR